MANGAANTQPAPYVSYGVFAKSIEIFAETTVPSGPIDRRILKDFSGADFGSLMSGLRFLGLIDDQRKATAQYRELVQCWKDQKTFKERLRKLIEEKYKPIAGDVNLKTGTSAELEKAFKDQGVASGQMLTKTIRFYLKAMSETGTEIGPHITARKPRIVNPSNKKNGTVRRQQAEQVESSVQSMHVQVPNGFERLPLPGMPNSFIQYPVNLTEPDCQILEAMIGVLRKSVEARTGKGEKKT